MRRKNRSTPLAVVRGSGSRSGQEARLVSALSWGQQAWLYDQLPPGQARAAIALLEVDPPRTYVGVATYLGVNVGTVYRHLRRIKDRRPNVYSSIMEERTAQLARYHAVVVERRQKRSLAWARRRYAARFRTIHGEWPWETYESQTGRSAGGSASR
jgi:hypothetical protein